MLRKSFVLLAITLLLITSAMRLMAAGPVGHYLMGKNLIANINSGRCQVGPDLRAILQDADAQRAFAGGAIGPDICEEQSHYNSTSALADKMLDDAMARYKAAIAKNDQTAYSKAKLELAFAYGWYTHCAEDLNVHPKVNSAAGDTYRFCNNSQKAIHAAQEAQLTAYLKSVTGGGKYDVYVPFDFLSKHVGVSADALRSADSKLRMKVMAELVASSKVQLNDKIRQSWRACVNGSMRDAESFLSNPSGMENWDLDCGKMTTAEFDELRQLAIEANQGTLPSDWGKMYLSWYKKTKGMTKAQTLETLKALFGKTPAKRPGAAAKQKAASKAKKKYAWVLTNTVEYSTLPASDSPTYSIAGSSGGYTLKWKSQGCYADGCKGEALSIQFTWNQPPKVIEPNQTIKMDISASINENTLQHYSCNGSMDVFFDRTDIEPGSYGGGPGLGGIQVQWKTNKSGAKIAKSVEGSPGKAYESVGKMALIVALYNGRCAGTKYIYEWKQSDEYRVKD